MEKSWWIVVAVFPVMAACASSPTPNGTPLPPTYLEPTVPPTLISPATTRQTTAFLEPVATPTIEPNRDLDPANLPAAETITIENAHSLERIGRIQGSINFSPDMRHAVWSVDDKIKVIALEDHRTIVELPEDAAVNFSPDGRRLAWETGTGTVTIRNLAQTTPDIVLEGTRNGCCEALTFSPDPQFLLVSDVDPEKEFGDRHLLRLWDVDQQDAPVTWTAFGGGHFSPTGTQIGLLHTDLEKISIWDVDRFEVIGSVTPNELPRPYRGQLFSPDWSSAAFSGNTAGEVYDLSTGEFRFSFNGRARRFSPDGTLLATAEAGWTVGECSNAVCLYDAYSGELKTLLAHSSTVKHVEFSPDGKLLATDAGGEIHLWDVSSGTEIPNIHSEATIVVTINFTPDGRYLLGYGYPLDGYGGIVDVWAVAPEP